MAITLDRIKKTCEMLDGAVTPDKLKLIQKTCSEELSFLKKWSLNIEAGYSTKFDTLLSKTSPEQTASRRFGNGSGH